LIEKEITTIKNVEEKRRLYYQELRRSSKLNNSNTTATANVNESNTNANGKSTPLDTSSNTKPVRINICFIFID